MQTTFRLPTTLVKAVDRYAAQLEARSPGSKCTRAEAVRLLLSAELARRGALTLETVTKKRKKTTSATAQ